MNDGIRQPPQIREGVVVYKVATISVLIPDNCDLYFFCCLVIEPLFAQFLDVGSPTDIAGIFRHHYKEKNGYNAHNDSFLRKYAKILRANH